MNIRVDLTTPIIDGMGVIFRSPVDCSQIAGLIVYYKEESKEFAFADAHGHNVGDIDHLFAENAVVKVILDVTYSMAYVQNADTNAYIERTFVKSVNGVTPDENGNVDVTIGGGLNDTASSLLITILRNGVYSTDQSANITALENALTSGGGEEPDVPDEPDTPVVTLTSISATYSGGDVDVGTAVADLTGIVVTAYYSDGTSEIVTGYTLSGEIAEGENTVTVSYQGKTATFIVNGIAESAGENNGWVNGEPYTIEWMTGYQLDNTTGEEKAVSQGNITNYLPCRGASAVVLGDGLYKNYGVWFYDENKAFVGRKGALYNPDPVPVPLNAYYVRGYDYYGLGENDIITPVLYDKLTETTMYELDKPYVLEWEYGKQINADTGVESSHTSTTRNVSTYAFCMGASAINIKSPQRSLFAFYDTNKTFISGMTIGTTHKTIPIPENAAYFRWDTYSYLDNENQWLKLS